MSKPVVSICIPTLNRCEQLKKTIESIVIQPEFIDGRVEIVISDNASTDDTRTVVEGLREKYQSIIYHRNEKNIGNENFPLVLSLGNGMLRKLNNDTLLFAENSLESICDFVNSYKDTKPVIFFPNGEVSDTESKMMTFRDFVTTVSYWVTWIGGFSIWEDDCDGLKNDTFGCDEKLWQVRKIYELACRKDKAVIFDSKYGNTQIVPKKDISYGLYHVFYENYMSFLRPYFEKGNITKEDIEKVERDLLFNFFLDWMIKWDLQNSGFKYSETEDLNAAIKAQYENKPYWKEFEKKYKFQMQKRKIKRFIKGLLRKENK